MHILIVLKHSCNILRIFLKKKKLYLLYTIPVSRKYQSTDWHTYSTRITMTSTVLIIFWNVFWGFLCPLSTLGAIINKCWTNRKKKTKIKINIFNVFWSFFYKHYFTYMDYINLIFLYLQALSKLKKITFFLMTWAQKISLKIFKNHQDISPSYHIFSSSGRKPAKIAIIL